MTYSSAYAMLHSPTLPQDALHISLTIDRQNSSPIHAVVAPSEFVQMVARCRFGITPSTSRCH